MDTRANIPKDTSTTSLSEVAADFFSLSPHTSLTPTPILCSSLPKESQGIGGHLPHGEMAENRRNRCSNFLITLSDTAYRLAEKNKKVVATYDTGCTRTLQGEGRVPHFCLKDIVKDSQHIAPSSCQQN